MGEIFCKNCYLKRFGPTVRTFNEEVAAKSLDLTRAKAVDPNKACVRCGGGVFVAEEVMVNGKAFHKSCSKCKACNKMLDVNSVYGGPDKVN